MKTKQQETTELLSPKADVLDQKSILDTDTSVSSILDHDRTKGNILTTLIKLKANGLSEKTVKSIEYNLTTITKQCNINNPEQVKMWISNTPYKQASKNKYATAYDHYCKINGIQWQKPYYRVEEFTPLIPTTQDIQSVINNASKRYAVIFTILAEIGCAPEELHKVTQKDINTENGIISIRGCKRHASGIYKLKTQTAEMLRIYLHRYTQEQPFPNGHTQSQAWQQTRRKTSQKLCNTEIQKIALRNLRNYSGAQFYHKVSDIIATMRHLRHKKIETTMHYLRGIVLDGEEEYTCKATNNKEEAIQLIEKGFQYVNTTPDGYSLYRKRK